MTNIFLSFVAGVITTSLAVTTLGPSPQLHFWLGVIVVLLSLSILLYCARACWSWSWGRRDGAVPTTTYLTRAVRTKPSHKAISPAPKPPFRPQVDPITMDAVAALAGLGMPRKQARELVTTIRISKPTAELQEVLREAISGTRIEVTG